MPTKLTSEERALACDHIASTLTEAADQKSLEEAYYNAQVAHLEGLGDAELLDTLLACDFNLEDL